MVTNRPINCYEVLGPINFNGVLVERGQRILWSSEFVNHPPITFIHGCRNHYIGLLPYSEEKMLEERYTHYSRFMSDVEYRAFRNREPQDIPANEVPFCQNRNEIIDLN